MSNVIAIAWSNETEIIDPDDFTDDLVHAIEDDGDPLEVKLQFILLMLYRGELWRFAAALSIVVESSACTCTDEVSCAYLKGEVDKWADRTLKDAGINPRTVH